MIYSEFVAECILGTNIPLGILPAGSANGMAKELNIDKDPGPALDIIVQGRQKRIHLLKINNEVYFIHLSDIGFNAFMIREFQDLNLKGMWGYIQSSFGVLGKAQAYAG